MSNIVEHNQLILLKSMDSTCLVRSALNLYRQNGDKNILFLAHHKSSYLKESFEALKNDMQDFDLFYSSIRSLFLKKSWTELDDIYGKSFFINEIQSMMQNESSSTFYFHRIDTLFDKVTHRDCERLVADILESARYYHKKVIFSINSQTKLGQILENVLFEFIDVEYVIEKTPNGICHSSIRKSKSDPINTFLLSQSDEIIKFHKYILRSDKYLNLKVSHELNEQSYSFLENADVLIFNLDNERLKNRLLTYIQRQNLKIKFIYLSDKENIRKRDLVKQVNSGIYKVYEKSFELSGYIHTLEKLFRRKFYSVAQANIETLEKDCYYLSSEKFKNRIFNLFKNHIYYSVVVVVYDSITPIEQSVIENCVRDQDFVYHDRQNMRLVFVLDDMLPSRSSTVINKRLSELDIKAKSSNTLSIDEFAYYLSKNQKYISKVV